MPYLGSLDEFGNTAIQPGAVFAPDPLSERAQEAKYWLSTRGLRYDFEQSLNFVSMSGVASGASEFQYYTATFSGKWAIFSVPHAGAAGWLNTKINL